MYSFLRWSHYIVKLREINDEYIGKRQRPVYAWSNTFIYIYIHLLCKCIYSGIYIFVIIPILLCGHGSRGLISNQRFISLESRSGESFVAIHVTHPFSLYKTLFISVSHSLFLSFTVFSAIYICNNITQLYIHNFCL